jgi:hypothetical protein
MKAKILDVRQKKVIDPISELHAKDIIIAELKDALEFSERVAVKLAKHIHNKPLICETNWDCPYWPQGKCAWCYLKAARIEVEEEMDGKA